MNWKDGRIWVGGLIIAVILINGIWIWNTQPPELPEKFTIKIARYGGSSGSGTRGIDSSVTFSGNEIIEAFKSSYSSGRHQSTACGEKMNLETGEWEITKWEIRGNKTPTGPPSNCHEKAYLTREEIIEAIKSGEITPKSQGCREPDTCYEIIED